MHTTTFAEMYDLSFGGKIIDTPGMREFGIVDISKQELSHYFPEMRKLINDCQFNNCLHINQPGCAVKQAFEDGVIHPERYFSSVIFLTVSEKMSPGPSALPLKHSQFHHSIVIFFCCFPAISWEDRNAIINIVMQGELLSPENKIPIGSIGIVDLVRKADPQFVGEQIRNFVEFVKTAIFSKYGFSTTVIVSQGKIHISGV